MSTAARLDEWGLRAAEQLETSVGAWVALASYKRLLAAAPPIAARALLGAIRCAASLRDERELAGLIARWARAGAELATDEPILLARGELARGNAGVAADLACAELVRRPTAQSAYAAARLLEGAGKAAAETFARAQDLARGEQAHAIGAACAARRLELLEEQARHAGGTPYRAQALAMVEDLDPARAEGAQAWWIARARLLAPGRYVRAGALSVLGELAERRGPWARAATGAIAHHVDAMGSRLTPLESERALAGLRAIEDAHTRDAAVARLEAVAAVAAAAPGAPRDVAAMRAAEADLESRELAARARALAEGPPSRGFARERFVHPFARLAALGLEALAALEHAQSAKSAQSDRAQGALDAAWRSIGPGEAVPAPLWSAALAGLAARGPIRDAAARLGVSLVQRAAGEPPEGFVPLGRALAAAGAHEPALDALRWAARAREEGATLALVTATTSAAWKAFERGETKRAHDLLLEARAASRPPDAPPR